ncbi:MULTISPECIES: hypothetical protein [unclassified Marinobacter]|uniref:hypothetical protein n=1 Tax=unclassified Marinobacter TaxID=83889 RepID=UPI00126842E5|nr:MULTISPECIES: hypothetical protein [unclassified Marinobacter]QFS87576.1 hypothetical protein FIV08_12155 [Marinobacter sp. THAF197a]QFT51361.1 hypothetical protein FIU96_12070 [Marinobacter sp. THAF39]
MRTAGVILYQGPSELDGQPIVAIATFNSRNDKTGPMVQTWILRSDVEPQVAAKAGLDGSVCGACPHRHSLGGSCYVITHQGPLAVYRAYKRGNYEFLSAETVPLFKGRMVRLGSYGDPAAVPAIVWHGVSAISAGTTGYTHQIAHPKFNSDILRYCMVSADTPKAAAMHQKFGRRTFRVKTEDSPLLPGEVLCLSETSGLTCLACGLCNGAKAEGPSVAINVHGSFAKRYKEKFGRINVVNV